MDPVFIIVSILPLFILIITIIKLRKIIFQKNELQERFNNLQRLSKTGYFERSLITEKIWWSEELKKLVGLDLDASISTKEAALNFIYEEDRQAYIDLLESPITSDETLSTECRGINVKTGELSHYRTTVMSKKDKKGNSVGWIGTVQDNTNKMELQLALGESELKRASVMSNIEDLVFVIDDDGIFRDYYSSGSEDELYVSPDKFMNKHFREVLPQSVSEKFETTISLIQIDGKSRKFDYSLKINDEVRWNNVKVSVFNDEDGKKNGYIVVARDFTTRKRIEEKLSESEMRFRELTELLPVAVFEIDNELMVKYVNKIGFEWFGYDNTELEIGISALDIVTEEDGARLFSNLNRRINSEDLGYNEYKAKRKNGEVFDIIVYATPIMSDNQVLGIRGVLMDISDRKKYLKELEKFSKFDSLSIIAAGIAHNFKNILAAIILSIDIIKLKPESMEKQLERITLALDHANALASRFQSFTRSNEPELSNVNINQILEETIDISLSGTSCEVETNFKSNLSDTSADSKQLNEAFINILINAQQAMTDICKISICTEEVEVSNNEIANLIAGNFIKISISDNGMGMSEEQLDKIFLPFYTTKVEGHGLGLSTVFSIIKSHNGSIQIESALGKGTKFNIYLPIINNSSVNQTSGFKTGVQINKKINIVLIDDDINITDSLNEISYLVNKVNFKTFNNPHEAIQYMKLKSSKELFEVAILDMTFIGSDINGIELLERIKEYYPDIKSLVFSGYSSEINVFNYFDYGFDGRLEKPCNFQELIDKVNEVTNLKKNA